MNIIGLMSNLDSLKPSNSRSSLLIFNRMSSKISVCTSSLLDHSFTYRIFLRTNLQYHETSTFNPHL